uniref:RanBP2-type domain-containing protein n=1 Tax=Glossina pallidipes TaxID=7398 RepID=A0A1A9ZAB7_GLOPL
MLTLKTLLREDGLWLKITDLLKTLTLPFISLEKKCEEKDQYGNEVQRMARPLPVEYLLVDVPATTPLQQQFTFTQYDRRQPFPVENRYLDGHLQDFNALSTMDMLPMRQHIKPLLEAVHTKNSSMAYNFKKEEVWKVLESLIQASSSGSGGTTSYPSVGVSSADVGVTAPAPFQARPAAGGGTAPAPLETSDNEAETWTCNHCTFINSSELTSCEICSLPR